MLRYCNLGNHSFDDSQIDENLTTEELLKKLKQRESVACKECWEEFSLKYLTVIKNLDSLRSTDYTIHGFTFGAKKIETAVLNFYFKAVYINPFTYQIIKDARKKLGLY